MKNLFFRISTILAYIKSHGILTIVVSLTIIIALLFQFSIIGSIHYNNHRFELLKSIEKQDTIYIDFTMISKSEKEIKDGIYSNLPEVKEFAITALANRIPAYLKEEHSLIYLQGVDEPILHMSDFLIKGRLPTEDEFSKGDFVALMSLDSLQEKNMKIGDTIYLRGKELKIIGSFIKAGIIGNVVIPYKAMEEISKSTQLQYQIYFWTDLPNNSEFIKNKFNMIFPEADNFMIREMGKDVYQSEEGHKAARDYAALQGALMFFLSILSIVLIAIGRLFQMKHVFGIKMTAGSTRTQIIVDCCIERFFFGLIALIINLILVYFFQNFIGNILNVLFSLKLIVHSFILVFIMSLIIGSISGIIATRSSVSELLKV